MNGENMENLNELFGRFLDPEQAEKAVEDIASADQILREHQAPEPSAELIADIKATITTTIAHRRINIYKTAAYKVAAVAAVIVILVFVGTRFLMHQQDKFVSPTMLSQQIWESDDIAEDDPDLAYFVSEIDQIKDEIWSIKWGENGVNGDDSLADLEMELLEINSDFWKG
jgi:hypothetical protein